jgi:hypothetical protein
MPKQQSDTDIEKVKQDITQYQIRYQVAVDNLHKITDSFQNEFVPAFFLIAKDGTLFFGLWVIKKAFQISNPK